MSACHTPNSISELTCLSEHLQKDLRKNPNHRKKSLNKLLLLLLLLSYKQFNSYCDEYGNCSATVR
jgi:hypothetical protein